MDWFVNNIDVGVDIDVDVDVGVGGGFDVSNSVVVVVKAADIFLSNFITDTFLQSKVQIRVFDLR